MATIVQFVPRTDARRLPRLSASELDVLRVVADGGSPVFLTVLVVAGQERRRFCHWQPWNPGTGTGNCYRVLPGGDCEALLAAGLVTLGVPLRDSGKTVRPVRLGALGRAALRRRRAAA